jgi:voltage-gated potassium channel Kch
LFQDLAVIPILAILPLLAVSGGIVSPVPGHGADLVPWQQALLVVGVVGANVAGGRFLVRPVFRYLASIRLHEIFTAAALLLVVGIALAMQKVGLVLSLVIVKFLLLLCIGKITNLKNSQNFTFGFALAQGGEFAFVLVAFAAQNQVIDQRIGNLLVATVALSMVMSPFLFTINERLGDASRMELLHAAGANTAKLMVIAIDDEEKSLEIVDMVHKHFPNLQILARAAGRDHAYRLLGHDVEHIFRETLGSSLDLSVVALRMLGFRAYEALRVARAFRDYDEQTVRELAQYSDDEPKMIAKAKERIRSLDELFKTERHRTATSDAGWNPPNPL